MKFSFKYKGINWKKTPVKVSHTPSKITGSMFTEGIKKITGGDSYLSSDVVSVLKKAGFGHHLWESSNTANVSKNQFLKAVKSLEDAGVVKHRPGYSAEIYNRAAAWESWEKTRSRNIERRKEEYIKEARQRADERARERENIHGSTEAGTVSATGIPRTEALQDSSQILKQRRDLESKQDKRDYIEKLRKKNESAKTDTQPRWSKGTHNDWNANK